MLPLCAPWRERIGSKPSACFHCGKKLGFSTIFPFSVFCVTAAQRLLRAGFAAALSLCRIGWRAGSACLATIGQHFCRVYPLYPIDGGHFLDRYGGVYHPDWASWVGLLWVCIGAARCTGMPLRMRRLAVSPVSSAFLINAAYKYGAAMTAGLWRCQINAMLGIWLGLVAADSLCGKFQRRFCRYYGHFGGTRQKCRHTRAIAFWLF